MGGFYLGPIHLATFTTKPVPMGWPKGRRLIWRLAALWLAENTAELTRYHPQPLTSRTCTFKRSNLEKNNQLCHEQQASEEPRNRVWAISLCKASLSKWYGWYCFTCIYLVIITEVIYIDLEKKNFPNLEGVGPSNISLPVLKKEKAHKA